MRHDAAHVLATAVVELWPGTKVSIGPPIEDGFYYDFEFPEGVSLSRGRPAADRGADAPSTSPPTRPSSAVTSPPSRRSSASARPREPYKVELIEDLVRDEGAETVSLYRNGPFVDLCRGPHGPSTGRIEAIKLSSVAGAYWRGDETRQMLTRIYGTAFFSKKDLEAHLERLELARANDHRKLGPQLGLFMLRGEAPGMPFWLPKGTVLLRLIEDEVRDQLRRRGYEEIKTPQIIDVELWHRSGHWDNYRENMFFAEPSERDRDESSRGYAVKPDELPRRLPGLRLRAPLLPRAAAAPGRVRRWSRATSARACCTASCACAPSPRTTPTSTARSSRSPTRSTRSARRSTSSTRSFGFDDVRVELSTRPEKSIGTDEQWERGDARRCARRSSRRVASTSSTRATAPSTGRRSTSTSPTRSAARGSSAPASSTSSCPSASTSAIRARTTPSTGR